MPLSEEDIISAGMNIYHVVFFIVSITFLFNLGVIIHFLLPRKEY